MEILTADYRVAGSQPASAARGKATILIAGLRDDDQAFLEEVLRGEPYRLVCVQGEAQVLLMAQREAVDMVILSSESTTVNGLACCSRIKNYRRTELVPVVMMTGYQSMQVQMAALSAGADEFLAQPLHPDMVRSRLRGLLRHKAATDRLEQSDTILFALAQAVELRDHNTGGHCERLGIVSLALGRSVGLSPEDMVALYRGGYLHDIGKVGVPDSILLKPGPLDEQEWQTMRTHTVRGEEICRPLRSLENVLPIIRSHHERWDGSGYPDGLRGEEIPLLARVLQMADIYDALVSPRPYKPALPAAAALEVMQRETDRGWRDPELMATFIRLHDEKTGTDAWRDAAAMQASLRNLQVSLSQA